MAGLLHEELRGGGAGASPVTPPPSRPFKIIIADDEPEVHLVTRMVLGGFSLNGQGVELYSAHTGAEAIQLLTEHPDTALILLDVVMEREDSGLEVARQIRDVLNNQLVRIVLRTGQPGQAPEERVIRDYDIDDYKAKTELTAQRLTTTVITALRTWQRLVHLDRQRRGLEHILISSVRLFELRSVQQFIHEALLRLCRLLYLDHAEDPSVGSIAATRDTNDKPFRVIAGTGRFQDAIGDIEAVVPAAMLSEIDHEAGIARQIYRPGEILCYHRVPGRYQMLIYVRGDALPDQIDRHLVQVYCLNTVLSLETLRRNEELQHEIEEHATTARELRRYQDTLEELVKERTAELEREIEDRKRLEGELITARDQAEAANASKSSFLAKMSHEVRTPLHGVLGMTRLLLESEVDVEQKSYATHAMRSGEMMLDIINDILDISKIEAGKIELESIEFDLLGTIEDICGMLAIRGEERGIDLVVEYHAHVPRFVIGDQVRLRQVVTNLVANAVKFTEVGSVLVSVDATLSKQGRSRITIRVADTGIGISAEEREHLFQEYGQASHSTVRRFGGTGLGLVISRQLLLLMGGELELDSIPGKGSTFTATVDLQVGASQPKTRVSLAGRRALVADPNPDGQRVLVDLLGRAGMRTEALADAVGVRERLAVDPEAYDVVLAADRLTQGTQDCLPRQLGMDRQSRASLVLIQNAYDGSDSRQLKQAGIDALVPRFLIATSLLDIVAALDDAFESDDPVTPYNLDRGTTQVKSRAHLEAVKLDLRVLLAEDNSVSAKVATAMLGKLGCSFELATDGGRVLELLGEQTFDVVLLDCHLPVMDGFEVVKRIREGEAGTDHHLPVIALTANTMPGDREACIEAGMDDYIPKPFDPTELRGTLLRYRTGSRE